MERLFDVLTPEALVERMYTDLIEASGSSDIWYMYQDLNSNETRVKLAIDWVIYGKAAHKYGRIDTIAYLIFLSKNVGGYSCYLDIILGKLSEYDKELAMKRLEELRKPNLRLVWPEKVTRMRSEEELTKLVSKFANLPEVFYVEIAIPEGGGTISYRKPSNPGEDRYFINTGTQHIVFLGIHKVNDIEDAAKIAAEFLKELFHKKYIKSIERKENMIVFDTEDGKWWVEKDLEG